MSTKGNGTKVFRDASLFKPIESDSDNGDDTETVRPVAPTQEGEEIEENNEVAGLEINPAVVELDDEVNLPNRAATRPKRCCKPPARLGDYVC